MSVYEMLFSDPVVYYSLIAIAVTAGVFSYLMFFFIRNIISHKK